MNFEEGIRYSISPALRAGYTREQIGEGLALSFMLGGTRTLVTVARALKDYDWPQKVEDALPWPEGWVADPAAFASGLDFSTMDDLPGETGKIIRWYEQNINWVPGWVRYLARHNPGALKGWRYRYENALVTLPKQVLPVSCLFAGAALEQKELTRENFLLARAWGVPLEQILQTIEIAAVYGTEKISSAYAAIGDLIDDAT
jgi:alkylhydroperoxidase/carboxymuconolactone decarboxylase family protein YurZ